MRHIVILYFSGTSSKVSRERKQTVDEILLVHGWMGEGFGAWLGWWMIKGYMVVVDQLDEGIGEWMDEEFAHVPSKQTNKIPWTFTWHYLSPASFLLALSHTRFLEVSLLRIHPRCSIAHKPLSHCSMPRIQSQWP